MDITIKIREELKKELLDLIKETNSGRVITVRYVKSLLGEMIQDLDNTPIQ